MLPSIEAGVEIGSVETPKPDNLTEHSEEQASAPTLLPEGTSSATASDATVAPEHARITAGLPGGAVTLPAQTASTLPAGLANHADYEIIRELGRGGMGLVYLAHNRLMGRDEVLKIMGRGIVDRPGALERFLREIRAVARLRHPNIATAYSAFRCDESLVFAMEYVEGHDLDKLVASRGPMPVMHACAFAHQAALGLQHAHEEGMIHRDIKPGNLMLSRQKDRAVIKVLDFGLAKASREEKAAGHLTQEGAVLGTPDFMAPEQIDDAQKADIRADIYSLGCTLYYLLSGHSPFSSQNLFEILLAHHSTEAPLLNSERPEVPAELASLVARMLAKDPDRRNQTPAEVAQELAPFFKKKYAARTVIGVGSPPAVVTEQAAPSIKPAPPRVEPVAPTPPPTPVAGPPRRAATPEAMWAGLIDLHDKENEEKLASKAFGEEPARKHPRWLWPALGAAAAIAALALGAVVWQSVSPSTNPAPLGAARTEVEADTTGPGHGPESRSGTEVELAKTVVTVATAAPGSGPFHERNSAGDESPAFGGGSKPPTSNSAALTSEGEKPIAAEAKTAAPVPADSPARSIAPAKVASKTPSLPVKSLRWTWIHDAPLPAFDKWVEGLRKRGYRPTFVNGHDRATHVRLENEPEVPGDVRIAALAVKDDRHLPFEVALDVVEQGFDRLGAMQRRGYQLDNMTTFTNGTKAYVLAIYTEQRWPIAYWWMDHTSFPEPFLSEWVGKSDRPFTIAGRPEGDFWAMVAAARDTQGVPWQIRHGLNPNQLQEVCGEVRAKGFRPETLFVCPGKARGGSGVVFVRDNPELLWEVHPDVPSNQLESDFAHMVAKGYALDQIVGYASSAASRYLVCWTRDPGRYPATGWCEPSLEATDVALEQFLLERHVPWCTFGAIRNGRLVASRGYGVMDQKTREPIAPDAALPLGDVSIPLAAAAVRSLIAKKKLRDDALVSEILHPPSAGSSPAGNSPAPDSNPVKLTIANLLDGVNPRAPKFSNQEREKLAILAGGASLFRPRSGGTTDLELRGALFARALVSTTGKTPAQAIADEVLASARIAHGNPARGATEAPSGPLNLVGSAPDVARFFLKHEFDGRPHSGRVKPTSGALLGREGDAQALVVRKDDLLFVVLFKLPADAQPQFTDDLRASLDRPVATPPSTHAPQTKRRSGVR
jgi:hypothetical protein